MTVPTTRRSARPRAAGPEVCRGWPREFEEEVLRHREHLHRRALRLCRNPVDAEDLVQETYLRAFRFFDQFAFGTNCGAWLLTILRHAFIGRVTRDAREVLARDESAVERALAGWAGSAATPEEEFFQHLVNDRHLALAVATAMNELPRGSREVLLLADMEGRSYREVAQMCELPIGTVMSRLFRARRRLRKALRDRRGGQEVADNTSTRWRRLIPSPRAALLTR